MNTRSLLLCLLLGCSAVSWAGAQKEEALSDSVQSSMSRAIADGMQPRLVFANATEGQAWLDEMSARLAKRIPDEFMRRKLLTVAQYEATRAGLDPQLVLGLIHVESGFNRYALSPVGARGLMQVMPFWQRQIGTSQQSLFDLATNLRYGCTILRHYLDVENGDLFRALGRYNGSLGKPEYPNLVYGAWKNYYAWTPSPQQVAQQ
ncbi:Transglycosylase SLT domain-containing protein [Andreprevotia lacus DSM 23236]|jgi:soluble lytic murein transglycosylase-like protein|uniref:Transglycosylase SLT domain-containing protein n=1 Tax=Andreprevotia lacus DSM 23236 TaxID=1121001 RepID=A0A1W1WWR9_9NEIS|nr:lytic transglycosylase domain-containing protein [Andreprevotia lacus]SMC16047.1 Transglycosylase SLT domain-containing protein [Andreprevotia lacus DSM 23236]